MAAGAAGRRRQASAGDAQGLNRKEQKRQEAEARQRLSQLRKPLQTRLNKLEKELDQLSAEKAELDGFMASADAYEDANRQRLTDAVRRQGEVSSRLAEVEEAWLEARPRWRHWNRRSKAAARLVHSNHRITMWITRP